LPPSITKSVKTQSNEMTNCNLVKRSSTFRRS